VGLGWSERSETRRCIMNLMADETVLTESKLTQILHVIST
jgi:hypothetical protein